MNLKNEEALKPGGLLRHKKKNSLLYEKYTSLKPTY